MMISSKGGMGTADERLTNTNKGETLYGFGGTFIGLQIILAFNPYKGN